MIILLVIAFIAGLLTTFTPCALPILPVILASGLQKRSRTLGVIGGLVTLFVIATVLLSVIVQATGLSPDSIRQDSMVLLLVFGLLLIYPKVWESIQRNIEKTWHPPTLSKGRQDFVGGFLTGATLGVVWTPCVGPIVAAVTALTASSVLSLTGWLISIAYGLGIGLSLWFVAEASTQATNKLAFIRKNSANVRKWFGVVIMTTAFFILFNFDRQLQAWTLEHLPQRWTQAGSLLQDSNLVQDNLSAVQEKKKAQQAKQIYADDIDPSLIQQGCPRPDCIPSIDDPQFETVEEASEWLRDTDVVFGIIHKGEARVYAQRILNWHEIVNDTIAGDPIAITFCPLCGSAIAFERTIDGKEVEFGVSGKLYNSNLIMYDRLEENYWQQVGGTPIKGPAVERREQLTQLSLSSVSWGEWKQTHPDSQVLSRETGFARDYDVYPYGSYEENNQVFFGIQNSDERLPLKEVVYAFDVDNYYVAYTESVLQRDKKVQDTLVLDGVDKLVTITYESDGTVIMTDTQGNEYFPLRTFWFAWAAFHPETKLYQ